MNINCLTLREETERPITVEQGTNKVVGLNPENIISEINNSLTSKLPNEIKSKIGMEKHQKEYLIFYIKNNYE